MVGETKEELGLRELELLKIYVSGFRSESG